MNDNLKRKSKYTKDSGISMHTKHLPTNFESFVLTNSDWSGESIIRWKKNSASVEFEEVKLPEGMIEAIALIYNVERVEETIQKAVDNAIVELMESRKRK